MNISQFIKSEWMYIFDYKFTIYSLQNLYLLSYLHLLIDYNNLNQFKINMIKQTT